MRAEPFAGRGALSKIRVHRSSLSGSLFIPAALICLLTLTPTAASRDPVTGQVRVLHLGKVWLREGYPGPILNAEPRISWSPVPTYFTPDCVCHHATTYGDREVREMRTKLPRSEEDLKSNYDVVIIDAMFALDMPGTMCSWVVNAVQHDGLGFMMVDDEVTFAGRGLAPSWYATEIGSILPVDDVPGYYGWDQRFEIVPLDEDHPLVSTLDFSGVWIEANNRPTPRPGSTVVAEMSHSCTWNVDKPAMVYWDFGRGRSFAYVHRWHSQLGNFYDWKYHRDFICHLVYFTADVPIPQDLAIVHDVRGKCSDVDASWQVVLSTMDLADKFGANLVRVNLELNELYLERRAADRMYIEQDFEACLLAYDQVRCELESLTEEVIRLKDAVMGWVFAIQWLSLAGTSMFAGFVIWEIMIRRRLYVQVGTTRLLTNE